MSLPHHVLLIANRTATTSALREAVARRAARGPSHFHLVVPAAPHGLHRVVDPEVAGREEASEQLALALAVLGEAAGGELTGAVGDADPMAAIQDALGMGQFDEIVISTLPHRISRWLRLDLPSKARGLGLPVTHVQTDVVPEDELVAAAA